MSILKLVSILLVFPCSIGCAQKAFIALDAPLEDVLPHITLIVPESEEKKEITVGRTYTGEVIPPNPLGESDRIHYYFLKEYAIEADRYIFVIVSYNTGGNGSFYYLTAVDKTTLKSVDEMLLGDRVKIEQVVLTAPGTVSVTYIERNGVQYDPQHIVQRHFKMSIDNKLREQCRLI